jgi:hypothetical protein
MTVEAGALPRRQGDLTALGLESLEFELDVVGSDWQQVNA